jgi:energy-coupling factor transport system permease protein
VTGGGVGSLVSLARARPARAGATRVVVVDGFSGSGKTTLARRLAATLDAPLVHGEDVVPGWDGLAEGVRHVSEALLEPLARGEPGRLRRWDWHAGRPGPDVVVPPAPVLVVEGCARGGGLRPARCPRPAAPVHRHLARRPGGRAGPTARRAGRPGPLPAAPLAVGGAAARRRRGARLVAVASQEWQTLGRARRARGVDAGRSPVEALRMFAAQVFALLVVAIRRGTRLAQAMDARGAEAGLPRTAARPQRVTAADLLLVAASVALLAAAAVAVSLALGTWRPLVG